MKRIQKARQAAKRDRPEATEDERPELNERTRRLLDRLDGRSK